MNESAQVAEEECSRLPELETKILEPYTYLANLPGKKIRTKLIEVCWCESTWNPVADQLSFYTGPLFKSFNHWLKIPDQKLTLITDAIELLHNSSLL